MSKQGKKLATEQAESNKSEPPLTATQVARVLKASARGAAELDAKLKGIFQLSSRNASLRLK